MQAIYWKRWNAESDFFDLTVTPDGDVLLHDEELAYHRLNNLAFGKVLFKHYIDASLKRLDWSRAILKANKEILASIGCPIYQVPGSFDAKNDTFINFMNGLFVKKGSSTLFFTGGHTLDKGLFMDIFSNALKANLPSIEIIYIGNEPPILSNILTSLHGGLRCMTWSLETLCDKKDADPTEPPCCSFPL